MSNVILKHRFVVNCEKNVKIVLTKYENPITFKISIDIHISIFESMLILKYRFIFKISKDRYNIRH